jgi:hypothetical protein
MPAEAAAKQAGQAVYIGDGAWANRDIIEKSCEGALFVGGNLNLQRASGAAYRAMRMIENGEYGDYNSLSPLYIRVPQAERERLAREK